VTPIAGTMIRRSGTPWGEDQDVISAAAVPPRPPQDVLGSGT